MYLHVHTLLTSLVTCVVNLEYIISRDIIPYNTRPYAGRAPGRTGTDPTHQNTPLKLARPKGLLDCIDQNNIRWFTPLSYSIHRAEENLTSHSKTKTKTSFRGKDKPLHIVISGLVAYLVHFTFKVQHFKWFSLLLNPLHHLI